mmetsp:Transcript_2021/g.6389  ORF Transcript_2021/g.6389 Transcript_2021/m.6389 type:complete len:215 (-) Transcript_2021:30-674(-)
MPGPSRAHGGPARDGRASERAVLAGPSSCQTECTATQGQQGRLHWPCLRQTLQRACEPRAGGHEVHLVAKRSRQSACRACTAGRATEWEGFARDRLGLATLAGSTSCSLQRRHRCVAALRQCARRQHWSGATLATVHSKRRGEQQGQAFAVARHAPAGRGGGTATGLGPPTHQPRTQLCRRCETTCCLHAAGTTRSGPSRRRRPGAPRCRRTRR